jgi:hypothetical protein
LQTPYNFPFAAFLKAFLTDIVLGSKDNQKVLQLHNKHNIPFVLLPTQFASVNQNRNNRLPLVEDAFGSSVHQLHGNRPRKVKRLYVHTIYYCSTQKQDLLG